MWRLESDAGLIYDPRAELPVSESKLELALNKAGALTMTLVPGHPLIDLLPVRGPEVWATLDGDEVFRGRVRYTDRTLYGERTLLIDGLRALLDDELILPGDLPSGGKATAAQIVAAICTAYNARNPDAVPFAVGTVGDFGTLAYENTDYKSMNELLDDLIADAGGYVYVTRHNGYNVLDWTRTAGPDGGQEIRFGVNILDLKEHVTGENVCSVIVPVGKDGLTIEHAADSGGLLYIEDATLAALFGRVVKKVEFREIDDPDDLYDAGEAYFAENGGALATLELTALDLCDAGVQTDRLRLGRSHRVVSPVHGLDARSVLGKISADILLPDNSGYTFGVETTSLTKAYRSAKKNAEQAKTMAATALNRAAAAEQSADAASAAVGALGDFVTQTGTTSGWSWRKWNSGIMEAWVASLACEAASWSTWGSTGMSIAHLSFDFPVTFFDTNYCVDVSVSRGATGGRAAIPLSSRHVSTSAASITIMTATVYINIADYTLDIHVIGRWK